VDAVARWWTTYLLAAGALAGIVFVTAFLIEGATRADYDALRQPVSSLSIGRDGWTQRLNFFVTGGLTLSFAVGVRGALRVRGGSRWAPILIGCVGIGLIGAGLFIADPYNGYPPGTPLIPAERSTSGVLHELFSTGVFAGLPAACFVLGRRFLAWGEPGWGRYSIGSGIAFIAAFVMTAAGLNQVVPLSDIAGLLQRVTIVIGLGWLLGLSIHLARTPARRGV
jgi:uncharacterized protein DUF998